MTKNVLAETFDDAVPGSSSGLLPKKVPIVSALPCAEPQSWPNLPSRHPTIFLPELNQPQPKDFVIPHVSAPSLDMTGKFCNACLAFAS